MLRDAMLAVSGTLNLEAGGPGFKPYIPPEANQARNIQGGDYPKDAKDDADTRRRSVYMFHKRLVPYPLFQAFDRPDLLVSCSRRQNTTVAPQAMALLNDRFRPRLCRRLRKTADRSGGDDDQRVGQEVVRIGVFAIADRHGNRSVGDIYSAGKLKRGTLASEANSRHEAVDRLLPLAVLAE